MDVFYQATVYLIHDIGLRTQKIVHLLQALLFSLNLELGTELVELR
jgi:hypothetical protein